MRISCDEWAMQMAVITAKRSTCLRRAVGCVLLNARGHVLATGYNGVAAGQPHCNEARWDSFSLTKTAHPHACAGANAPSGTALDACHAIHAEQNALLQCRDPWAIDICYVTAAPCMTCVKLLLNTSCRHISYLDEYPQPEALELWRRAGRSANQVKL